MRAKSAKTNAKSELVGIFNSYFYLKKNKREEAVERKFVFSFVAI